MNEITLKIYWGDYIDNELEEYINSLNGVYDVIINSLDDEIYI